MNNIAISGAGPAGLATACLIKAMNPSLEVDIFEKRDMNKKGRSHGLAIANDSIAALTKTLEQAASAPNTLSNKEWSSELIQLFKNIKNEKFVSTTKIVSRLADQALKMGITIHQNSPIKTKEDLENIKAAVVIAADGSHSPIRDFAIGSKRIHEKNYQYMVELKYKTAVDNSKRSKQAFENSKVSAETKHLGTTHRGRTPDENGLVEATDLIFVDESTHKSLLEYNEKGAVKKGVHGSHCTQDELKEKGVADEKVKKLYSVLEKRLAGRKVEDFKVTTIPISVYRNEKIVNVFNNKIVVGVGDVTSGLVFYRGLNKAWIEATYLAKAVSKYFKDPIINPQSIPAEFVDYEKQSYSLFLREKRWIDLKNIGFRFTQFALKIILGPLSLFFSNAKQKYHTLSASLAQRIFHLRIPKFSKPKLS